MEYKLTDLNAFIAMSLYLDKYYNLNGSDDIGALLGEFQLFEDVELGILPPGTIGRKRLRKF